MIAAVNPAPAIIIALLDSVITEAQKRASVIQLRNLMTQAKRIKEDIEQLKVKQEGLKMAKDDTLKAYIAVKEEKANLKSEINALKGMLENNPAATNETLRELSSLIKEGGILDKVSAADREGYGDLGLRLYEVFYRSKDRLSLDLSLLYSNFRCDPVYHSNGGVADFKIMHKEKKFYASEFFRSERLDGLLDKWERFTRQRPAYKVAAAHEAMDRMLQARQQRQSKGFKMKMR